MLKLDDLGCLIGGDVVSPHLNVVSDRPGPVVVRSHVAGHVGQKHGRGIARLIAAHLHALYLDGEVSAVTAEDLGGMFDPIRQHVSDTLSGSDFLD